MIYSQHVIWAFVLLVLAFTATYFVLFPFARSTSEAKVDSSSSYTNINEVEEVFLSVPREDSAREHLRYLTSQSHVAGTPGDRLMAQYVHDEMKKAGIPNVSVFDLDVYLNFPKNPPSLTLMSNETLIYRARLSEEILSFDNTSDTFWRNRTFHGYSPSGVVNAPMVFANYGRPQDFELLQKAGVDVRGTICIIRYGKCFRGLKVLNAQTRGAVGVILYSDPQDDGYDIGSEYPDGPWRPSFGVERGSVQFNSLCAGDPMRVDQRYNLANAVQEMCGHEASELIPQIPSLPISHEDALPLLKHMGGKSARDVEGDDFCGGLDVEYTVGPSDGLQLILQLDHEGGTHSIPNVVGIIPGRLSAHQDMPILLGNHRDAWYVPNVTTNSHISKFASQKISYLITSRFHLKGLRSSRPEQRDSCVIRNCIRTR
jgi:N-acetylated-alpha-linked acidic dipeptidase